MEAAASTTAAAAADHHSTQIIDFMVPRRESCHRQSESEEYERSLLRHVQNLTHEVCDCDDGPQSTYPPPAPSESWLREVAHASSSGYQYEDSCRAN